MINQFTAIPLEAGVSFKFIQGQPNHQVYITADINGCPNVFNGHFTCGTVGSAFTNGSDVDFSGSNGAVGDTLNLICDGNSYYVTGNSAQPSGLMYNDC